MKWLTVVTIVASAIALAGCKVDGTRTLHANEFEAPDISYQRDTRTNLCYAVIAYNKMSTNGSISSGYSLTNVPCSPEVEKLIN